MVVLIVSVGLVVIVSAACSLFEAILYSVPFSHIEALAQSGRASGRILRRLRLEVDRPIAAILSLNTIANTAGAAVAGAVAAQVLGHAWIPHFSAGFTLVILIFSEVLPKTAGVVYARSLAALIARPLNLLVRVMAPLVFLSRLVTRLVSHGREEHSVSEEELLTMVRLGGQSGTLGPDEADAIANLISLKSRTAENVMTPRTVVFARSCRATVEEIKNEAGSWAHGRIPLYDEEDDDVIGIVHRRDVLAAIGEDRFEVRLSDLMHPAHFIEETLPLDQLLSTFLERRQHMFVVLGEFGDFVGVVTLEDVLEEILGREIVDEFDQVEDMRELARRRRQELVEGRLKR